MKIVLLESLAIPRQQLDSLVAPLLAAGHEFQAFERAYDEDALICEGKDADVLILANMPLSGRVIRACERVKLINVAFTGVDHIDLTACREQGIAVSNAAGYATRAVAELTVGQMLSLLRNIPAVEARCRQGGTKAGLVGRELSGCTVGVIGTGATGQAVAQLCGAFGSRVLGCAPRRKPEAEALLTYAPLETVLRESDVVTLHCPLTEQTRGMIGARELALMKPTAFLINMARGPVVDADALAQALKAGKLAGAAVDVFDREPPLSADNPLLSAPNCRVTPHVAFATAESMAMRAEIVFRTLYAWLDGKRMNEVL